MATYQKFVVTKTNLLEELQAVDDNAERIRLKKFKAVKIIQRMTRGYLIRKWVAWLSFNACIIQRAFRCYQARMRLRYLIKVAVLRKLCKSYCKSASKVQALWRGYRSRCTKFCYKSYRRWLRTVTERGERRAAEAAEYKVKSRADDLRILEEEARKWLAFVVFKLHHLLRTYCQAGIYSDIATSELTEFEELLKAVKYLDYRKRLQKKYEEFVKKHKPLFSNKRLFPIIGEGQDYWYLSLVEMYEMTAPPKKDKIKDKYIDTHHGKIHKQPFLWRNPKHNKDWDDKSRGPFIPKVTKNYTYSKIPAAPSPTPFSDAVERLPKDPRFHLYVKHYKPDPELFQYVDFYINVLLTRKSSISNIGLPQCYPTTGNTETLMNTVGRELV